MIQSTKEAQRGIEEVEIPSGFGSEGFMQELDLIWQNFNELGN